MFANMLICLVTGASASHALLAFDTRNWTRICSLISAFALLAVTCLVRSRHEPGSWYYNPRQASCSSIICNSRFYWLEAFHYDTTDCFYCCPTSFAFSLMGSWLASHFYLCTAFPISSRAFPKLPQFVWKLWPNSSNRRPSETFLSLIPDKFAYGAFKAWRAVSRPRRS